jgi:hypothetical protein
MALIDVTIDPDGSGGFCTSVGGTKKKNPTLKNGVDDVRWTNNTGDKVILFVPHDGLLGDDDHFHQIIRDTKAHKRSGPNAGIPAGKYAYAIFCLANGTFAHNSDLEIIVQ